MIRKLEQVAALVVAAGLALVSYWLFFSWAGGGGVHQRQPRKESVVPVQPRGEAPVPRPTMPKPSSKSPAGLQ